MPDGHHRHTSVSKPRNSDKRPSGLFAMRFCIRQGSHEGLERRLGKNPARKLGS